MLNAAGQLGDHVCLLTTLTLVPYAPIYVISVLVTGMVINIKYKNIFKEIDALYI